MPPGIALALIVVACIAAVQVFTVFHLWKIKEDYRKGAMAYYDAIASLDGARFACQSVCVTAKEMMDKVTHLIRTSGGIVEVKELPPRR